jgi:hypothetical protein
MAGIILEGMDNTGKSTLAKKLSQLLAMPVFTAGPPPRHEEHAQLCVQEQHKMLSHGCILDRVTCISDPIYQEDRYKSLYGDGRDFILSEGIPVVYCRPPTRTIVDFSAHEEKSYDTDEHLEKLAKNRHLYVDRYDKFFLNFPHILYDWTDPCMPVELLARELLRCRVNDKYYEQLLWNIRNVGKVSFS